MRCVERGSWPLDGQGNAKNFHPYNNAKRDLLSRIGEYCCYCERRTDLHIDHVIPQTRARDLIEDWTNFLLACKNCNGTKGGRNHSRNGYIWPDLDDTESAFEYMSDGRVRVRDNLPESIQAKALKLFELVGLGRTPGNDPSARDRRWSYRRARWGRAKESKDKWIKGHTTIDDIVTSAKDLGFWSVWMTVFADYPEVRARLREAFPGTRDPASGSPSDG